MPEISLFYGIRIWCEIHKDELMQNWELSNDAKPLI